MHPVGRKSFRWIERIRHPTERAVTSQSPPVAAVLYLDVHVHGVIIRTKIIRFAAWRIGSLLLQKKPPQASPMAVRGMHIE